MLHILQSDAGSGAESLLQNMFASRKSVFVDLLKWDVPVLNGRYEIDQFDNEDAVYLIVADDQGAHLGSARVLRSEGPHILGDLYPQLCEGPVPTGPRVREITRFCLDRALTARQRRDVRDALVASLVDYALSAGIDRYTAIAGIGWVQQILAFGWECWPLGTARDACGGMLAALEIRIDPTTPSLLAAAGITDRLGSACGVLAAA